MDGAPSAAYYDPTELARLNIAMPKFVVQVVSPNGDVACQHALAASSPEQAVWVVTGEHLARGNHGSAVLRAKVYTDEAGGARTLVKFYDRDTVC